MCPSDPPDLDSSIEGTQFTLRWILDAIYDNDDRCKTKSKTRRIIHVKLLYRFVRSSVLQFSSGPIGDGQGFISRLYKLTIEFQDSPNQIVDVVLKVLSVLYPF